jgi:hypothetical protein
MSDTKTKNSKNTESTSNTKRYVVTRSGLRVSEQEYQSKEEAQVEFEHWKRIVNRWPDGSKIEIAEFDEKRHKV